MQVALKTRLIGALVIIAVIVIVVPMFFSGKPTGGAQSISLAIPKPPDQALQTRTMDVAEPASAQPPVTVTRPPAGSDRLATVNIPARPLPNIVPGQLSAASANTPAPVNPPEPTHGQASSPSVTKAAPTVIKPKPKPKPVAPVQPPAATAQPGRAANAHYLVSLGAYANKGNAERLVAKVGRMGYPAHVSAVSVDGKPAARVDVGPFGSRAGAEVARLKLHAHLPRAPAVLISAPTNQSGNAPAAALPKTRAGGWAVQVVAYSQRADADGLRDRLRKAGFDSYVDDIKANGQTLWRVRVGPLAQRDEAVSTLDRIKAKFPRLHGVVVTVP
ncbi:MAG TPA: SPOR domain-containing protein [Rhodanobacteraceae bacterium]